MFDYIVSTGKLLSISTLSYNILYRRKSFIALTLIIVVTLNYRWELSRNLSLALVVYLLIGFINSIYYWVNVSVDSTTLRGVRKRSDDDAYGNRHQRGSPCTGDALRSAPVAPHTCSDAGLRAGVHRISFML